jgi:hypothetical protein
VPPLVLVLAFQDRLTWVELAAVAAKLDGAVGWTGALLTVIVIVAEVPTLPAES